MWKIHERIVAVCFNRTLWNWNERPRFQYGDGGHVLIVPYGIEIMVIILLIPEVSLF